MPDHVPKSRSYTQLRQWAECGERYRLERLEHAPSRPGVWLPAGTAVHAACEEYLRNSLAPKVPGVPEEDRA